MFLFSTYLHLLKGTFKDINIHLNSKAGLLRNEAFDPYSTLKKVCRTENIKTFHFATSLL